MSVQPKQGFNPYADLNRELQEMLDAKREEEQHPYKEPAQDARNLSQELEAEERYQAVVDELSARQRKDAVRAEVDRTSPAISDISEANDPLSTDEVKEITKIQKAVVALQKPGASLEGAEELGSSIRSLKAKVNAYIKDLEEQLKHSPQDQSSQKELNRYRMSYLATLTTVQVSFNKIMETQDVDVVSHAPCKLNPLTKEELAEKNRIIERATFLEKNPSERNLDELIGLLFAIKRLAEKADRHLKELKPGKEFEKYSKQICPELSRCKLLIERIIKELGNVPADTKVSMSDVIRKAMDKCFEYLEERKDRVSSMSLEELEESHRMVQFLKEELDKEKGGADEAFLSYLNARAETVTGYEKPICDQIALLKATPKPAPQEPKKTEEPKPSEKSTSEERAPKSFFDKVMGIFSPIMRLFSWSFDKAKGAVFGVINFIKSFF